MKSSNRPPETGATDAAVAVAETRAWIDRAVVGLALCPFAAAALRGGRTRLVCSGATDAKALLGDFIDEVRHLVGAPATELETTLLVAPFVLADFDVYNDFLDDVDRALHALDGDGALQVASFHPRYRFAGTRADDITNATNRSPYPVLQLLREDSVAAALASIGDSSAIYERNIATMRALGRDGWAELRAACRRDALVAAPPRSTDG